MRLLIKVVSTALVFVMVQSVFATQAYQDAVDNAVVWLDQNQNQDGSWGSSNNIKVLASAEAVLALRSQNKLNDAYYRGMTWLQNHDSPNVDYKTRRILALAAHGNNLQADLDYLKQVQQLINPGNQGWGLSATYNGAALDSALVLQAYTELNETTNVQLALDFLKATQLTDTTNQELG